MRILIAILLVALGAFPVLLHNNFSFSQMSPVEVAIFMYQTGASEYKVSLRSQNIVDVSRVASFFGGGGHVRAAGCTMSGSIHDVINNLSLHIEKQLNEREQED